MLPHPVTPAGRSRGFTIIEFMIAITLSLLVLAALTGAFVANSRSRTEIERANQQMENGRFALQLLSDDLQLAGYLSHLNLRNASSLRLPGVAPNPLTAKPNPCAVTIASIDAALLLHVQGYDSPAALPAGLSDCLPTDVKPRTDIVVVRRTATCVAGTGNCAVTLGAPYFQASLCGAGNELGDPDNDATRYYRLAPATSTTSPVSPAHDRNQRDCTTRAVQRQFLTHIYFVASNDQPGDGIPTLKRAEMGNLASGNGFTIVPLAHGIEDLQVEYGIDTDGGGTPWPGGTGADGIPNVFVASPDTYNRANAAAPFASCAAALANCMQNWGDVMAVRLYVLARNTTASQDHLDTKAYILGRNAAGAPQCAAGSDGACQFNDRFKRHVYSTSVRLNNPAGRRI
jgi:type IV pilus assembly protein PilW